MPACLQMLQLAAAEEHDQPKKKYMLKRKLEDDALIPVSHDVELELRVDIDVPMARSHLT